MKIKKLQIEIEFKDEIFLLSEKELKSLEKTIFIALSSHSYGLRNQINFFCNIEKINILSTKSQ